ncbi:hypothetical protein HAX54_018708, partial [Datura stramonium]|nr:hypothetical protein [Datura stramonium]
WNRVSSQIEKTKKPLHLAASLIGAGTPSWATTVGPIYKSDLNIQTKHWLGFVFFILTPSKNDNEILPALAILITCIMADVHINMGDINP